MLARVRESLSCGRCAPCKLTVIRGQDDVERLIDHYEIDISDALRLSSFISWLSEYEMEKAGETASNTQTIAQQQEVLGQMSTRLYSMFVRCFILQLVNSIYHRSNVFLFDNPRKQAVLGYIRHCHNLISDYKTEDLVDICCECFERISERWREFEEALAAEQKENGNENGARRASRTVEELGISPSEEIAAQVTAAPTNLQNGSQVEPSHVKYRMAYGMMVGLETTVRVDAGLQLFTKHVNGMSSFKKELEKQMQNLGYPFCCDSFFNKPATEGSEFSVDLIDFVLSTTTFRYLLPQEGTWFSPQHIMGNVDDLWFDDLAPSLFARIREVCGIENREYLRSVARRGFAYIEFLTNSKSGEIFFFSHDGKFLLKTISNKEARQLLEMLPEYLLHIESGKSFLMRICGLHRFSSGTGQKVRHFLVAMSVFHTGDLGLHHQYDLKGSLVGRQAKNGEQVKKDRDWINDGSILNLPVELKRQMSAIVEADIRFLARQRVLDYSVLVGVHDKQSPAKGQRYQSVKLLTTMLRNKILPIIRKARKLKKSDSNMSTDSQASRMSESTSVLSESFSLMETDDATHVVARTPRIKPIKHLGIDESDSRGTEGGQSNEETVTHDDLDSSTHLELSNVSDEAVANEEQLSAGIQISPLNPFSEGDASVEADEGSQAQTEREKTAIEEQDPEYAKVPGPECNDSEVSKAPNGVFFTPSLLNETKELEVKAVEPTEAAQEESNQFPAEDPALQGSDFSMEIPSVNESSVDPPKKNNIYGRRARSEGSAKNLLLNPGHMAYYQPSTKPILTSEIPDVETPRTRGDRILKASPARDGSVFDGVHPSPSSRPESEGKVEQELNELRSLDSRGNTTSSRASLNVELKELASLNSRGDRADSVVASARKEFDMRKRAAKNLEVKLNRKDSAESDEVGSPIGSGAPTPRSGMGRKDFDQPNWEEMLKSPNGPICGTTVDMQGSSRYIYFMGIIDFLTPWNAKKQAEFGLNRAKGQGNTASCMPPDQYAKRQIDFFNRKVLGMYTLSSAVKQQAFDPGSSEKNG